MAEPAVATEIHQPLDIHRDLTPEIALDHIVAVDDFADLEHFRISQLGHPALARESDLLHDLAGLRGPDAMDVLQCDHDAFVSGYVDACDAGHGLSTPAAGRQNGGPVLIPACAHGLQRVTRHPPRFPGPGIV